MERVIPTNLEEVKEFYKKGNVMIDLKTLPTEEKANILKYVLTDKEAENIDDPLMALNVLNLIKVYNTLDDEYFKAPDIYVNSVEELLDLKLSISKDLKQFSKTISIYFLSLLKSYSKMSFTPTEEHVELPALIKSLFLATDLTTISGVFAKTSDINTNDLFFVDNAYLYMTSMVMKCANSASMINDFYNQLEVKA